MWKLHHEKKIGLIKEEEEWLVDSGATAHLTNTEKYLFNKVKDRSVIVVGTGKETKTIARGDIMIRHSGTGKLIKLKDVLLVLSFKQNIISIPKLLKNNFKVQNSGIKFEIEHQGKTIPLEKSSEQTKILSHRKENTEGTNKRTSQKTYNRHQCNTRFIQPYE